VRGKVDEKVKMNSALYYPFTGPQQTTFLKTAMFLWDSVDFIVPHENFHQSGNCKAELEALELIGRKYVPTLKDKEDAHNDLEDICTSTIGDRFIFELEQPDLAYNFYPQKLLPETWEMLEESKLAKLIQRDGGGVSQISTGPLFGYYMMTILAICCARNRKRLITDQSDPYRALTKLLGDDYRNEPNSNDWHSKLISLSFAGPDFSDIPLERLTKLRKKENKLMCEIRHNFLKSVDKATSDISDNSDNANVVKDRIQEFTQEMEKDLKELKRALRRSATSLMLSKEFCFSVIATTAVTVAPVAGVLTAGSLAKGLMDYQDRRRDLLKSHPSSWLFSSTGSKMKIT